MGKYQLIKLHGLYRIIDKETGKTVSNHITIDLAIAALAELSRKKDGIEKAKPKKKQKEELVKYY